MKLLFPNDEHGPVDLNEGIALVGAGAECQVRLTNPGIAVRHCELITENGLTRVRALTEQAATVLNGKQIAGETAIKPGDLLLFAKVGCRVVASERVPMPAAPAPHADADEDSGHTRIRMALPKYVLRGVSGPTFGKVFAMAGSLTVGRSSDSDICIPIDEISRHHARLQAAADGVMVEDLGSANGTFINNQPVHGPTLLKGGDELRMDTVRFLLMAPGMEAKQVGASTHSAAPSAAASGGSSAALWIIAGLVLLGAIALGLLRYFGKF